MRQGPAATDETPVEARGQEPGGEPIQTVGEHRHDKVSQHLVNLKRDARRAQEAGPEPGRQMASQPQFRLDPGIGEVVRKAKSKDLFQVGFVLENHIKFVDGTNRVPGKHPLALSRAGGEPDNFDDPLGLRQQDVGIAKVGVRNFLQDGQAVAQDDLLEFAGQLGAHLLAGHGRHLAQVHASENAIEVLATIAFHKGAHGRPGRSMKGRDAQGGRFPVLFLHRLLSVRVQFGDSRDRLAVEQPAAVGRSRHGNPFLGGKDPDGSLLLIRDEVGVHSPCAKDGLQLRGEQAAEVLVVGRQTAEVQAGRRVLDALRSPTGKADGRQQGANSRPRRLMPGVLFFLRPGQRDRAPEEKPEKQQDRDCGQQAFCHVRLVGQAFQPDKLAGQAFQPDKRSGESGVVGTGPISGRPGVGVVGLRAAVIRVRVGVVGGLARGASPGVGVVTRGGVIVAARVGVVRRAAGGMLRRCRSWMPVHCG